MSPGKNELKILDEQIDTEVQRWRMFGMAPIGVPLGSGAPGINVDLMQVRTLISVFRNLIIENGWATEEELEIMFKKELLERLTTMRKETEEERKKAELLTPDKRLYGPNGKPLN